MEGGISNYESNLSYYMASNKALRSLCGEIINGLSTLQKTDLTPEQSSLIQKLKHRLKQTQ